MEASEAIHYLLKNIGSLDGYQRLLAAIQQGKSIQGINLPRAARLPMLAQLYLDAKRPLVYITDRSDRALLQAEEMETWLGAGGLMVFPAPAPLFYEQAEWGTKTRRDRLRCLAALSALQAPGLQAQGLVPCIVSPLRAVMTRTMSRREYLRAIRLIKVGQAVKPEEIRRDLVTMGYNPVDAVYEPGCFVQRGGILDIWTASEELPVRIEFFGNEVESIRQFTPATQRSHLKLEKTAVTPAREFLSSPATTDPENQPLNEFFIAVQHPYPACLLDFLPKNCLIVVEDMNLLHSRADEVESMALRTRQEALLEGTFGDDFPKPYLAWDELQDRLHDIQVLELGFGENESAFALAENFQSGMRFNGRLKEVINDLQGKALIGEESIVVSRQASRLKDLWREQSAYLDEDVLQPVFYEKSLSEGWVLARDDGSKISLLTDSEIFGWGRPSVRQRKHEQAEPPETRYDLFQAGDWVVHVDHGIGQYSGTVRRSLEGVEREYLVVEYANNDQVFVPVHQADRLTRYIGADAHPPRQARIGGAEWTVTRHKVESSLVEVAQELLEIYAKRQMVPGFAFSTDTPWQDEMEASFPYIETPDQVSAIAEVKRDMETPRPMDRLLCGDVGYGKTEVALRAAFKAVMDGKQVAILAPTTVLAQQHFETFSSRLAVYPVKVEMLSRFRSPAEQREILFSLYRGDIDIIIGTHRLLQSDVLFKDLGLLIIDEEQRFGVAHKEYFKQKRTELDVLTLTATPIPRTLYMALTGVRDISTINTPPQERLPIITHVGPFSDRIVRQAVLREIERGGQIFFVHNRVMTIEGIRQYLHQLVPEARIDVGHGQMPEQELSEVMHRFTRGDVDILLCTSIIESGLDIPNANTLIVDRADTFGLAQLYQLRGRVGRGAQRAYAYFFRHRSASPTPEGQERMEVIAENTQLGSGYSIAMRDLEMRGAGELLGIKQHGNINAVGFHLYTRMLAQAVHQLRLTLGDDESFKRLPLLQVKALAMPVTVELPLPVGIDLEYVSQSDMRLKLYRRIADLEDQSAISAMMEEFNDRFGPLPENTRNLFYLMRVKLMAEEVGLAGVSMEDHRIQLRFPNLPEGVKQRSLPELGMRTRTGRNGYYISVEPGSDWQEHLLQVLYELNRALTLRKKLN